MFEPNFSATRGRVARVVVQAVVVLAVCGLPRVPLAAQSPASLIAGDGIGRLDPRPAATLLLPYFEVAGDADGAAPPSFEVTVASASSDPVLAHVTLWTDLSVPTLSFDIYLTGFDVETFDLNALFTDGTLPVTLGNATPGPFSGANFEFPNCDTLLPAGPLSAPVVNYLRLAHSGLPIPTGFAGAGLCAGRYFGQQVYRGYLTLDVVDECSLLNPTDPGYFADAGQGVASNDNVLWGQYVQRDGLQGSAELLVHVEARDSVASGYWEADDPTFYGRFVEGSAIDNREPLATAWAGRYWNGAQLDGEALTTEIYCWRDSGVEQQPFDCALPPAPFPLGQGRTIAFNEDENLTELLPEPLCPWEATRVSLADLGVPFQAGWIYLDLAAGGGAPVTQSYVSLVHRGLGDPGVGTSARHEIGYQATPLSSALAPRTLVTEDGIIFVEPFETGDLSRWSTVLQP